MFMQEACVAVSVEPSRAWPLLLDTDDLPKKKLQTLHRVESPDELCYIDFSVSTTGMLTGAKVCLSVCPSFRLSHVIIIIAMTMFMVLSS